MSLLKQAAELAITIKLHRTGAVLSGLDKVRRKFRLMFRDIRRDFRRIRGVMSGFMGQVAAMGLAIGAVGLAKNFIDAAASIEMMEVRLGVLLRSTQQATIMFKNLFDFAMKVPFALDAVMEGSVRLAAVMDGGRAQVEAWLPLVADLAGAVGMTFEDTAEQIMRMYGAGAAAAVRFRKRGVLAMLGFQAGVSYSAEETRKTLVNMWKSSESKFRGGAEKMKNTWRGLMSMLGDAWLAFRKRVMDAGLFNYIKVMLKSLTGWVRTWGTDSKSMLDVMFAIVEAVAMVRKGVIYVAQAWRFVKLFVAEVARHTNEYGADFMGLFLSIFKTIQSVMKKSLFLSNNSFSASIDAIVQDIQYMKNVLGQGGVIATNAGDLISKAMEKADLEILKINEDLKVTKHAFGLIARETDRQGAITKLTEKYTRLHVQIIKLKKLGERGAARKIFTQTLGVRKELQRIMGSVAFAKLAKDAEAAAEATANLKDNTALMLGTTKKIVVQGKAVGMVWGNVRRTIEGTAIALASQGQSVGVAWNIVRDALDKTAAALSVAREKAFQMEWAMSGIRQMASVLGSTLKNEVLSVVDQIFERTKTTKEILADITKSLSRAATKQAVSSIFSAVGSMFGVSVAADGGIFNTGGVPVRAFAGGDPGGGITNGPEIIVRGERNHGRDPEAHIPLNRNRKVGVEMKGGGGGDTFNVTMNISAMDGHSFRQFINNPEQLKTLAGAAAQNAKIGR